MATIRFPGLHLLGFCVGYYLVNPRPPFWRNFVLAWFPLVIFLIYQYLIIRHMILVHGIRRCRCVAGSKCVVARGWGHVVAVGGCVVNLILFFMVFQRIATTHPEGTTISVAKTQRKNHLQKTKPYSHWKSHEQRSTKPVNDIPLYCWVQRDPRDGLV